MDAFYPVPAPAEYSNPFAFMSSFGVTMTEALNMVEAFKCEQFFVNSLYQVNLRRHPSPLGDIIHLSIKRHDKAPVRDWQDMQEIKNQLVGPENEAMEIYPAESRLVDCANQYHAWVLANPHARIPVPYYLEHLMSKPGPKRKPVEQRLWEKVDMSGGPDSCWVFQGGSNGNGYGVLSRGGDSTGVTPFYAHRLAFCLANGLDYSDLTPSQEVMHSCDNRSCCNPSHLSLGSSKDNKRDAISKGRMFWQKAQRNSKGQFESDSESLEGD